MIPTQTMSEAELIELCVNGDSQAQRRLYDKYKRAMYTIAYRMTGDHESAQDILQDAFVKVFRALPRFRQQSTLGAWIKTIVVRTALTAIKREKTFEPIDYRSEEKTIDWSHRLDAEYLEKAIYSLSEGYRAVFVLIEVEGYSHKEVAEMLGVSVGTSKSQLFYAKRKLREIITNLLDNE